MHKTCTVHINNHLLVYGLFNKIFIQTSSQMDDCRISTYTQFPPLEQFPHLVRKLFKFSLHNSLMWKLYEIFKLQKKNSCRSNYIGNYMRKYCKKRDLPLMIVDWKYVIQENLDISSVFALEKANIAIKNNNVLFLSILLYN